MNHPLIDIDINRTIHDASDLMAEKWIRHLPITENRKIVGILFLTQHLLNQIAFRHNAFQLTILLHQEGSNLFGGHLLRRMLDRDVPVDGFDRCLHQDAERAIHIIQFPDGAGLRIHKITDEVTNRNQPDNFYSWP